MTVLLSALVDLIEADLADSTNTTWSAADLTQWVRDAIADYSPYFPRVQTQTITTTLNDRQYDLAAGFIEAISIEYPTSEDPPQYLKRRPYNHPDFWSEDGYYDILPNNDDGNVNEVLISTKPPADETITVTYQGHHDNTIATNAALTVPAVHHYLLRSYVRWKAADQLAAAEEPAPTSNSSLLMSQLASNAGRYKRDYLNSLAKALQATQGKSHIVSWQNQTEETTRIY